MSLALISAPAEEPVTLADAKSHLRVDASDEDALITSLITAARIRAEWHTGRAFVTQIWKYGLDAWPPSGVVEIPLSPLSGITGVAAYAIDGSATVVDAQAYYVDTSSVPGRLILKNVLSPPVVTLRPINAVEIRFTAGYGGASDVPDPIRQAILCIVADLFTNRGDENTPIGAWAQSLLAPYRTLRL